MKNAIIVKPENIGLLLDRLQRTLPKGSRVRTQSFYTRSLRVVNELSRREPAVKNSNGEYLSSCVGENWHMEIDVRPSSLPLNDKYLGGIHGKYNNVWDKGGLIAMHTGRHREMHNFLRLKVGDRVKFNGTTKVFVECDHLRFTTNGSYGEKCIQLFERV